MPRLPRLTYANVMATIAVFVSLGGASYGAVELPGDSVGSRQLQPGGVTLSKLAFPLGIASSNVTGPRGVGRPPIECGGCPMRRPTPEVLTSVALRLRKPSQVLLLASAKLLAAPGKAQSFNFFLHAEPPSGGGQQVDNLGATLDEELGFDNTYSFQTVVASPSGLNRYELTTTGTVTRRVNAFAMQLVAIAVPTAG